MCSVGDIIVIQQHSDGNAELHRHSFIVLNNEGGQIQGLDYDLVCNVISSFKSSEQRLKKLSFPGNLEYRNEYSDIKSGNNNNGYIKAEQLYYFTLEKTDYTVIGCLKPDFFAQLIAFIKSLDIEFKVITDNL